MIQEVSCLCCQKKYYESKRIVNISDNFICYTCSISDVKEVKINIERPIQKSILKPNNTIKKININQTNKLVIKNKYEFYYYNFVNLFNSIYQRYIVNMFKLSI